MNKPTVFSVTLATIIEYGIYATSVYIIYKHVSNKITERCLLMVDEDACKNEKCVINDEDYICDACKNENEK